MLTIHTIISNSGISVCFIKAIISTAFQFIFQNNNCIFNDR